MGCDGGTIPKRDELVKTKQRPEQKDKNAELVYRWFHCTITQEPLQRPIVACQMGRLYSKESVLQALLDGTRLPPVAAHIRNMRDIRELNLTPNPAYEEKPKTSDTYEGALVAPYICPLIGLEMNGRFRFAFLWTCGCVMSERALKNVSSNNCLKCQKPFTADDVIVLNGNEEDLEGLKNRLLDLKEKKKLKKEKNAQEEVDKPSTSSCSSKANGRKRATDRLEDPDFKKTKANYSVAKDPKATEVYKSLFTSHKSAGQRDKAHWVTYNPFYN